MYWAWFGLAVGLIVFEAITIDLVAVWFAISALVMGIVVAIFPSLDVLWQVLIFLVLATILLASTRRFVKKFLARKKGQETNLELVVDHVGMVEEDIDNDLSLGAVKINGLVWTARSLNGDKIEKDTLVIIKEIKGNKLFVIRK